MRRNDRTMTTKVADTAVASLARAILHIFYCSLLTSQLSAHPVNVPGSTSVTRISNFPFYQRIVNPCGVSIGVPTETAPTLRERSSVFTSDFVAAMGVAINLTIDALEELEKTTRTESVSCEGVSLLSLPTATTSTPHMTETKTMTWIYKTGIYLVAHLHLVTLDRGSSDDNDIDSTTTFLCENEPVNYLSLVDEVTRRLENIMCTAISGANLQQRASFRRPLEQLEATRLYRYEGACTAMQTRDCIVFRHARQVLTSYRKKFNRLSQQIASQQDRQGRRHHPSFIVGGSGNNGISQTGSSVSTFDETSLGNHL